MGVCSCPLVPASLSGGPGEGGVAGGRCLYTVSLSLHLTVYLPSCLSSVSVSLCPSLLSLHVFLCCVLGFFFCVCFGFCRCNYVPPRVSVPLSIYLCGCLSRTFSLVHPPVCPSAPFSLPCGYSIPQPPTAAGGGPPCLPRPEPPGPCPLFLDRQRPAHQHSADCRVRPTPPGLGATLSSDLDT